MLMTKWGKSLDKNNPLCEYPRPQFVRNSFLNLNGIWKCAFTDTPSPEKTLFRYDICVPFSPESELSGVKRTLQSDEYLVYKREFEIPNGFNKGRLFLHFGAVDQTAKVYINSKLAGSHKGGYTPFKLEITSLAHSGKNEITVVVSDATDKNEYSRGKQKSKRGGIWYTPQSGIWQTVWIESTPKKYLESVKITPDFDSSSVSFEYFGADDVEVSVFDGDKLIAKTKDTTVKIPGFKPWSPESPFLYGLEFNACGETIKSYFAMRKFSVSTDSKGVRRLFLNNKPYFQNGLLDQGYYPDGLLTPPSYKAMEYDIKFAKEAGFNMLRKHIKIEPLMWYHYCDKYGIIVWQDMVNGGGKYGLEVSLIPFFGITLNDNNYSLFRRTDAQSRKLYYTELRDTVNLLYNSPCIALWVPFNEGWGQFDSAKAYRMLKELDKTRIVDTASGWHDMGVSDVVSKHIYFTPIKVKKSARAYVLSEFGGLGLKLSGHTFSDKMFGYKIYSSRESLTRAYSRLYKRSIIPQIKDGLAATVYTQLTDVEDELNGLLTYDREVQKIDIKTLKALNKEITSED